MFEYLIRYIWGFVKLDISGRNVNRFLNICSKRDIVMWGIEENKDGSTMFIKKKDFDKIKEPGLKAGIDIKVLKYHGLPFLISQNKWRIYLPIFTILVGILLYIQSLFVWKINIVVEGNYTEEEIINYIEENCVSLGTLKKSISCYDMEVELRKQFDEIAWISCSLEGTVLTIELSETVNPEIPYSGEGPTNIVAVKDSVVTSIVTSSGMPVVKRGDEIKKGDILISGTINLMDDSNEVIDTNYVQSEGLVYGVTYLSYLDTLNLDYYKKDFSGNEKKNYSFKLGENYLRLTKGKIKYDKYDTDTETKQFHIGDTYYMPFSIILARNKEYELVKASYTEKEAESKLQKRLSEYIVSLKQKGVQILENNVKISTVNGNSVASGTIKVVEVIGVPQKLDIAREEDKIVE